MFYRLKNDTHTSIYNGHGYITNTGLNKRNEVGESDSVFLKALSQKPQTLEQLSDKLLETVSKVDKATRLRKVKVFYDKFVEEGFLVKGETREELDKNDKSMAFIQPKISPEKVNFYFPALDLDFLNFFVYFAKYSVKHYERFMNNIRIASFYGTFKNAIWAGGRANIGMPPSPIDMEDAIRKINDAGIAARYTFTNSVLEEKHLNDTFCNLCMEIANNGKNEVLVNSPVLEKYLRKNYPNFGFIQSITACEHNIDKINEATEKYSYVVIDFHDNHNQEFLDGIKHKDRIEILIDGVCPTFCNMSHQHYKNISLINTFQENLGDYCLLSGSGPSEKGFYNGLRIRKDSNLTFEEVYTKYYEMGFRHFKLVGRNGYDFGVFESLIYYLVNPEWRDDVRAELADYYIDYLIKWHGGRMIPVLDQPIKQKH